MNLKLDPDADALYLRLDESAIVESQEVAPGIVVDYNADDQVVGIEVLHLSMRAPSVDTGRLVLETGLTTTRR